jgi:hypothetical protein
MLRAVTRISLIAGAVLLTQLLPHGFQQATDEVRVAEPLRPGDNTLAARASRPDALPEFPSDDNDDDRETVQDVHGAHVHAPGLVGWYLVIGTTADSRCHARSTDSRPPTPPACDFWPLDAPHAPPWRPPIYAGVALSAPSAARNRLSLST